MLKDIDSTQLRVGMYVQKLHCSWLDHPFMKNQFLISSNDDVARVREANIRQITIDISKGKDVESDTAPKEEEPVAQPTELPVEKSQPTKAAAPEVKPSIEVRTKQAKNLVNKASNVVTNIMSDIRSGKKIDLEVTGQVVSSITRMLAKDSHTLLGVSRLKTKDEYTFIHSVSVSALMAAFASGLGYPQDQIDEIALGGLLHDIGKALTPNEILNKPGKLTDEEFVIMRQHAVDKQNELLQGYGLPQLALDVITMHHERPDGKGYPLGLKGDELSEGGRMSAIVDIYDALTSVRVYKDAWEPTVALKKMLSWCPDQLDRTLMEKFIKVLGIYPVGSLVEMASGKVALVSEQNTDLLRPILKVIYDGKNRCYLPVEELDLTSNKTEKILQTISPTKYGINVAEFI